MLAKPVTKNDVLSFVYDEIETNNKRNFIQQFQDDLELNDWFAEVVHIKKDLDKIEMRPSERVVKNILNYSKNYANSEKALAS